MRASVFGARTLASSLFSVPLLTSLCDSSIQIDVPPHPLEVRPVAAWVLQGVDRDDHPVEVGEGIAPGRDPLADPLDAFGVQTHEWEGEPAPQLVLDLVEDVARHDAQDPFGPASCAGARSASCRPRWSCQDRPRRRLGGAVGAGPWPSGRAHAGMAGRRPGPDGPRSG